MMKSMTGYGKSECVLPNRTISIAIRAVNSKQLDIALHMPAAYRDKEADIRSRISKIAQRGKIDVSVNQVMNSGATAADINIEVLTKYFNQLKSASSGIDIELNSSDALRSVLRLPGVLVNEETKENDEEWAVIFSCLQMALDDFNQFRETEGEALIKDILLHITNIEKLLLEVEPFEIDRINAIKTRIQNSLNDLFPSLQVDKNRFEQELIYYIEKLDISEEKVRLQQHCNYFRETIASEDNSGRKIGFICQEIGREINTLGSKANNADIQKIVVQMKDELEKIKEQVLNVL